MDNLTKETKHTNKKHFSLFKELLHESIHKYWDHIIRHEYHSSAGYIELGDGRVPAAK